MRHLFFLLISISTFAQTDEKVFREIYSNSLTQGKSYEWLDIFQIKLDQDYLVL